MSNIKITKPPFPSNINLFPDKTITANRNWVRNPMKKIRSPHRISLFFPFERPHRTSKRTISPQPISNKIPKAQGAILLYIAIDVWRSSLTVGDFQFPFRYLNWRAENKRGSNVPGKDRLEHHKSPKDSTSLAKNVNKSRWKWFLSRNNALVCCCFAQEGRPRNWRGFGFHISLLCSNTSYHFLQAFM